MTDTAASAQSSPPDSSGPSEQPQTLSFRLGVFGAAVPLVFFVVWAITLSVLRLNSAIGLVMGLLFGLVLGLFFCKSRWADYAQGLFEGMTQTVGVVAIVAWFFAGMFAQVLQTGGLVEGLVWLGGLTNVTGGLFVTITFLLAALFATAVGTGYGTTVAFCTLMYPAGVAVGADPVFLFAAILSGASFGDNLAPVSDTTIVSATTQDADVPGVVRSRFKYVIIAAIPAAILFAVFGSGQAVSGADPKAFSDMMAQTEPLGLVMLVPFVLVLVLALSGQHIITSLTWGILASIPVMLIAGTGAFSDIIGFDSEADTVITGALVQGVNGYLTLAVLILLILAAAHLLKLGGTMEAVTGKLMGWIKQSVRRAELAIWSMVALLNTGITINTAAEITAAPFVRTLGGRYRIHRYRRANMLDAMTSALGYIFPWSAAVLLGFTTIQSVQNTYNWLPVVPPTQVFPFVFHGWFLVIVMLVAALTGWGLRFEGPNAKEVKRREDTVAQDEE